MRDLTQMKPIKQNHNACGTASLAMVINFLTEENITWQEIDKDIRRGSYICACPPDLVNYARKKGLQARQYNHGTLDDIKKFTGMGLPMIAFLDPTPDNPWNLAWHWVAIVGAEEADGQEKIINNNPSYDEPQNPRRDNRDIFEEKWANLKALGIKFGYDKYFIGVGTEKDTLPAERTKGLLAANTTEKGLSDVLNGWAHIRRCKLGGLCQLLGGVVRLVVGAISLVFSNIYWLLRGLFISRN